MKKLNITKKQFKESQYFTNKYGNLEYVSESGKLYKTDKGQVIKFVNESKYAWKDLMKFLKTSDIDVDGVKFNGCEYNDVEETVSAEFVSDDPKVEGSELKRTLKKICALIEDECPLFSCTPSISLTHSGVGYITISEEIDPYSFDELGGYVESSGETHSIYVTDIEWDIEDWGDDDVENDPDLPESLSIDVPKECVDKGSDAVEEYISDYLSNEYGYSHNGFTVEGLADESMDIRKHRFMPKMNTSTKAMKSMKDKERDRERRNWKQKLRNGDYDEYDESTQENWHGIDGATYSDDERGEFVTYYGIDIPYDDLISQLQTVYLHEVNSDDKWFEGFDDWMAAKTSSAMIEKELSLMSDELDSYRREDMFRESEHHKDWFGVKGAKFIYHGDWNDPEVQYDGVSLNYWDVEEILLDEYREGHPQDKNDKGFDDWMALPKTKSSIQSALDILVQGGCGEPIDDESEEMDESLKDGLKKGWDAVKDGAKKVGKKIGNAFKGPFRKGDHIKITGNNRETVNGTITDWDLGDKTYKVLIGNSYDEGESSDSEFEQEMIEEKLRDIDLDPTSDDITKALGGDAVVEVRLADEGIYDGNEDGGYVMYRDFEIEMNGHLINAKYFYDRDSGEVGEVEVEFK